MKWNLCYEKGDNNDNADVHFFFLITSHHTDYTCGNTFTAEREKNLTSNMVFMRRNLIVAFKTECCLQFFSK